MALLYQNMTHVMFNTQHIMMTGTSGCVLMAEEGVSDIACSTQRSLHSE